MTNHIRSRGTRFLATTITAAAAAGALSGCVSGAVIDLPHPCSTTPRNTSVGTPGGGSTGNGTRSAATDLTESAPIRLPTAPGTTVNTSGFGPRWGTMHRGIDFAGPEGTPIYSALDGTVVLAGSSGEGPGVGFENWIVIDSLVDGAPVSTVYGHMFPGGIHVKPGDKVTAGQHIAEIGNAGSSTGAHLHFEYWPGGKLTGGAAIDPMGPLAGAPAPDGASVPSAPTGDAATPGPDAASSTAAVRLASNTIGCNSTRGFGTPGAGQLKAGSVPPEFEPWFRKAGALCPQITPALLAADTKAESGFQEVTSPAGARGYTQFIDSTWASYGKDEDGNGVVSRGDIGDAVMAQGRYMCDNAAQIDGWIADGKVTGDPKSLYIAAYNAGSGAVLASGGMPSGSPDYENETKPYVARVLAYEAEFTDPNAGGAFVATPASPSGPQVITAARQHLGLPYVWGGGNINGPSDGGFDCSGLTSYAVYTGTGGRVTLPRTSEQQWTVGTEIPVDEAGPGDLLFGNFQSTGPGHVALALGGGQMIEAPQSGDVVHQAPVRSDMKARRVL
ncbi:MAG: peptidoglycan DD-metalloendopeptidase family protein [Rhodococcus sp. (in: high G+C Gram-positive bacteria)]